MDATLQKSIIAHYVRSYNAFDVLGMLRDLHESVVFENISQNQVDLRLEGKEAFARQAETAATFFQTRTQRITDWEFDGPLVRVHIAYHGLLAQDLPNGLKAGATLELTGQSEFTFEGPCIIKIVDRS